MRKVIVPKVESPKIGSFLKVLRKKFYLSQEEIAKRIGVSRPTLIKIESDKADVTLVQAKKLADFYNISLNDLLRAEDTVNYNVRSNLKDLVKTDTLSKFNKEDGIAKLKEVIMYLWAELSGNPEYFEPYNQNIIFLIEVNHFKKFGSPIFGLKYIKNNFGPVSKIYSQIINELQLSKKLELINSNKFTFPNIKYLPLEVPNFSKISADEKISIDQIITTVKNNSVGIVNELMGKVEQYQVAQEGSDINIYSQKG